MAPFKPIPLLGIASALLTFISVHYFLVLPLTRQYVLQVTRTSAPVSAPAEPHLANATFVVLCRNEDLGKVLVSVQEMEDRFNARFGYPWVFLNDKPFDPNFMSRVRAVTRAPVAFGLIPREQWQQPEWINTTRAELVRKSMKLSRIPHGGSLRHRNMYRFNAGFMFRHKLLSKYKYYWRVEPGAHYFCDLSYDPFLLMQRQNKTYGFNMAPHEVQQTILMLWENVYDYIMERVAVQHEGNMWRFLTDDGGDTYTFCHYEGSFEIMDMDFLRGADYIDFFDYLDRKGGIYYERWGSAPIISIATSLFLRRDQVHFFEDIGYRHEERQHCPQGDAHVRGRCSCDPADNFDRGAGSCLSRWEELRWQ
ncbi:glycosyltransferase family 15 protein [Artomyces pyxidatus]|uniref:Glycosyltransferase family 15 protein n=1 Tax=Artomyces pyxidatus TaxID=48021 RepID=A0ACB8T192_9AGAM|nr:glycosyltransferase family 15 protein [Artomyces pyxidatus]